MHDQQSLARVLWDSRSIGHDGFTMTFFFLRIRFEDLTRVVKNPLGPDCSKIWPTIRLLTFRPSRHLLNHTCHTHYISPIVLFSPFPIYEKLIRAKTPRRLIMTTRSIATRLSQSLRAPAARAFSSSPRASQAPVPKPTKPASQTQPSLPPTPTSQLEQIKQYPAHPLLQFFRTYPHELNDKALGGTAVFEEASKDSISAPKYYVNLPHAVHQNDLGRDANSRSWLASELRLKSSKDLHTLWYVLLMERNRLATAWEELHRVGARQAARMWSQSLGRKNHRVCIIAEHQFRLFSRSSCLNLY